MEAIKKIQTVQEPIKSEKIPNIAVETFLSLVKYFLIIIVIINIIWASILIHYVSKSFNGTAMEVMQDGTNNNQSVTNG